MLLQEYPFLPRSPLFFERVCGDWATADERWMERDRIPEAGESSSGRGQSGRGGGYDRET